MSARPVVTVRYELTFSRPVDYREFRRMVSLYQSRFGQWSDDGSFHVAPLQAPYFNDLLHVLEGTAKELGDAESPRQGCEERAS